MRCYTLATARQHLAQVTSLILDGQQLEQVPPEVWQMPHLETLDLQRNALKVLPETIGELKSLKHLLLGNNQLQTIPQPLPNLVQIDLKGNRFTDFPVVLTQLKQLQIIDLGSNLLRSFPDLPLLALKDLNLSGNKIATCSLSAAFLPKLEKLRLSRNGLQRLQIQGVFSSLDAIDLSNNRLPALPDNWSATPFLRHLYANNNQLAQVPATLSQCSWLKTLHLSRNKLHSLPNYFVKFQRLEELDLEANIFSQFPALPASLRKLGLAHNQLARIPIQYFQQSALRKLDLSHNPLPSIRGLEHCAHLTQLELKGLSAANLASELLLISRPVAIKSTRNDPQWTMLLNFIRACQRKHTGVQQRQLLWDAFSGKSRLHTLPLDRVMQGMNLSVPAFQQQLREQLLVKRSPNLKLSGEMLLSGLALIGRSTQTQQELKNRLESSGIPLLKPEHCTFWVLGNAPYPEKLPIAQGIHWLDERMLEQLLRADTAQFDAEEQQNLLQLLLHHDPAHVQLALQLLQHHGVPRPVLPYLYLVWRWTTVAKLKRELRALLARYWPGHLQEVLRRREKVSREIAGEALEARVKEILDMLGES